MVILIADFSFGVIVVYAQLNVFSESVINTKIPAFIATAIFIAIIIIITAKLSCISCRAQEAVDRLIKPLSMNTKRTSFITSAFILSRASVCSMKLS